MRPPQSFRLKRPACFVAAVLLSVAVFSAPTFAAPPLPGPLTMNSGQAVQTPEDWTARRAEMRDILLTHEYGHAPEPPAVVAAETAREEAHFTEPADLWAVKVTARLRFGGLSMEAGYWRPRDAEGPVPVVLAMEPVWWPDPFLKNGIVQRVLARGYAFAGFDHNALASFEDPAHRAALDAYPDHDWGVVAVGAWGYRVAMNWLESLPELDAKRVAVWGHSRRGKSALLAGALDERFAAVVPHMSGMGGSALYRVRGKGAQRIDQLLEQFWLHPALFAYMDSEDELPLDQHWLHALVAPRPMCVHTGRTDHWGNPAGERAAIDAARPVYDWLGKPGNLVYYEGDYGHHDPNGPEGADSWETLLDFLDLYFKGMEDKRGRFTATNGGRHE